MLIRQLVHGVYNRSAGPTYSVGYLAEHLAELGNDVEVVSQGPEPDKWPFNVVLRNFSPETRFESLLCPRGYIKHLRKISDSTGIVHGHGIWRSTNLFPYLYRRNSSVRMVCSPRGMLSAWSMNHKRLRKLPFWQLLQKRALERVHAFHVTAVIEMEDVRRLGFNQPVFVVPNGIDVPLKYNGRKKKQVLFLSRINPKKGLDILLQAWKHISPGFPEWDLLVSGALDSGYAAGITKTAEEMQLKNIRFSGELLGKQKTEVLNESSLFVLPTYSENFGIVVAEALAHSVPVITTTETPWQDLKSRKCGWYISPDAGQLSAAMQEAMKSDSVTLAEMGDRGREWMREKFSWRTIAENTQEAYSKLLSGSQFDILSFD